MTKSSDNISFFADEAILGLASISCLRNTSISITALLSNIAHNLLLIQSKYVVFNTEKVVIHHLLLDLIEPISQHGILQPKQSSL
jgi:hypothetical protein